MFRAEFWTLHCNGSLVRDSMVLSNDSPSREVQVGHVTGRGVATEH